MKKFLLTCEHGGNEVPEPYQSLFEAHRDALNTHRGIDFGALELAQTLQQSLDAPLFFATTTRLLIELNRSLHHPRLFSAISGGLSVTDKQIVINTYYVPYRTEVENWIEQAVKDGHEVVHVSVHSFTPVLGDEVRNCEIGLLYDPKRLAEKEFCAQWKAALNRVAPSLRVRYNYPYKGSADGFTTYLRKKFPERYAGIELEVNQGLLLGEQKEETIRAVRVSMEGMSKEHS